MIALFERLTRSEDSDPFATGLIGQPKEDRPMTNASASNLLGAFIWYDQMSNDLTGAEAFYTKVVGWKLAANTMNDQRYTLLQAGAAMIGGLMPIPDEAKGVRPAWMGYIAVDDVKAYADKVKAAGGSIHRPPSDIPNVGTFAVADDPHGAGFLLFKPKGADGPAPDPDAAGHVGWRELHAGDGPSALDFYSGLFGWTKGDAMDMGAMGKYLIFSTRSGQSGGVMTKSPDTPAPMWLYYFNVDAIDAATERVKAAGGRIVVGPMEVPGDRWMVQGFDPQGAAFGLLAPKR
jgi:predicted enzyme related to lactoylglutathione lyase